ncbi:hypothetical protein [Roseibium sp. M-1]
MGAALVDPKAAGSSWSKGSVACGLLLFGETLSPERAVATLVIIGGVIALKILPS